MRLIIFFAASFILCSCASTYKPIRPEATYYPATMEDNHVTFSYKLGVLREHKNKKYAKREDRKAIRLAAVKIVNESDKPLTVGKDLFIMSGNSDAVLLDPFTLHRELKQGVPIYLLYLLLTNVKIYQYNEFGGVESSTPIGFALGPGLAFGNMLTAGNANQNFLREMMQYNIIDKTVGPHETLYGIVGVRDIGYAPLSIRMSDESSITFTR